MTSIASVPSPSPLLQRSVQQAPKFSSLARETAFETTLPSTFAPVGTAPPKQGPF